MIFLLRGSPKFRFNWFSLLPFHIAPFRCYLIWRRVLCTQKKQNRQKKCVECGNVVNNFSNINRHHRNRVLNPYSARSLYFLIKIWLLCDFNLIKFTLVFILLEECIYFFLYRLQSFLNIFLFIIYQLLSKKLCLVFCIWGDINYNLLECHVLCMQKIMLQFSSLTA